MNRKIVIGIVFIAYLDATFAAEPARKNYVKSSESTLSNTVDQQAPTITNEEEYREEHNKKNEDKSGKAYSSRIMSSAPSTQKAVEKNKQEKN